MVADDGLHSAAMSICVMLGLNPAAGRHLDKGSILLTTLFSGIIGPSEIAKLRMDDDCRWLWASVIRAVGNLPYKL